MVTEILDGITVLYFPLKAAQEGAAGYLIEYLTAFFIIAALTWRVWRQERFDILHICNPPDMFFPLAFFYRLLGAQIIFDHHVLFPEFVAHRFQGLAGKLLCRVALWLEYLTYRSANTVISVNESYRTIAMGRGRVPPGKSIIVRNGPKVGEFTPLEPQSELKRGFAYLACYLGVMGHEDGIRELLDAINHVINRLDRRDIFFYLMGDGALRPWALDQIAAQRLGAYVDMPGMIRDKQFMKKYLSTADVCLSPEPRSPLNEQSTFIKVAEYMAMAKPVIAFDLRETHWTAQEAAFYIPPGDVRGFGQAIVDLIDQPERREAMGASARKRFLEQLAWEHQKDNLLQAYEDLLKKNPRQRTQQPNVEKGI
jgi:glycosyltransferase involved in cell wall biosynthesis